MCAVPIYVGEGYDVQHHHLSVYSMRILYTRSAYIQPIRYNDQKSNGKMTRQIFDFRYSTMRIFVCRSRGDSKYYLYRTKVRSR